MMGGKLELWFLSLLGTRGQAETLAKVNSPLG